MTAFVLTVTCPTRRGIVAAISGFLAAEGCNITDAAQFDDTASDRFFARITFRSEMGTAIAALTDGNGPRLCGNSVGQFRTRNNVLPWAR